MKHENIVKLHIPMGIKRFESENRAGKKYKNRPLTQP